jgi:hypothetical protein
MPTVARGMDSMAPWSSRLAPLGLDELLEAADDSMPPSRSHNSSDRPGSGDQLRPRSTSTLCPDNSNFVRWLVTTATDYKQNAA